MRDKYKILIPIFLLVLILTLTSCKKSAPELVVAEGELVAGNELVDYAFSYPSDFVIDKNSSMISIYVTDDDVLQSEVVTENQSYGIITHPNLSVTTFAIPPKTYENIDSFWEKACLPLLNETYTDLQVTTTEDVEIDGSLAKRFDYTAKFSGMDFKYSQVFIFRKGYVYTITYTATTAKFDKYLNVLDTVTRTLTFK